jgi:hypothetical protein
MMWTVASVLHFFASSPCIEAWIGLFLSMSASFSAVSSRCDQPACAMNEESRVMGWWSSTADGTAQQRRGTHSGDLGHVRHRRQMTGQRRQNACAVSSMKGVRVAATRLFGSWH